MKIFTTVELSKEDFKKPDETEEIIKKLLNLTEQAIRDDIPAQLKITNLPPIPRTGFRRLSES